VSADQGHVIVFRSRLRPGVEIDYDKRAGAMYDLAMTMPGLLASKDFVAEDGERVAIIEFDSADAWTRP
jgi:antibiotic biosynthesis monooxygenase (ABM) superfamily enzyme